MLPLAAFVYLLAKPTITTFIAGGIISILGEAIRIWGVGYAGPTTRSSKVEAPMLITAGPYSYVRNPLYAGNLIIGLGFTLMGTGRNSLLINVTMMITVIFFYFFVYGNIVILEEGYLAKEFGEEYHKYCQNVNRFIPRLYPYQLCQGNFDWKENFKSEIQTLLLFFIMLILMGIKI